MKIRYLLLFFSVLLVQTTLRAKHIVGGDITYECVDSYTLNGVDYVKLKFVCYMYRDCAGGGASFDFTAQFGIFKGKDDDWETVGGTEVTISETENIDLQLSSCITPPNNVCLEKGKYEFTLDLPVINENYTIAYLRCCRNNTIINLENPESTGATFSVEVTSESLKMCNNSPTFNSFPPPLLCVNTPFEIDVSVSDKEGHEFFYELCAPLNGGGTKGLPEDPGDITACDGVVPNPVNCPPPYDAVVFKAPFAPDKPLGNGVYLDPNTGILKGIPLTIGQFVVGICVKEYVNGTLLSVIRRDFQFNVSVCEKVVEIALKDTEVLPNGTLRISQCVDSTFTIINDAQDENFISSYKWKFYKGLSDVEIFDTRDVTVSFPGVGQYTGKMIINENEIGCNDSIEFQVEIFPDVYADFVQDYDTCVYEPVLFSDKTVVPSGFIKSWDWTFDDTLQVNNQNPKVDFKTPGTKKASLMVTDINDCRDTIEHSFDYYPVPTDVVVQPFPPSACMPAEITFNNKSNPINELYTYEWIFNDDLKYDTKDIKRTFTNDGIWDVYLKITSPFDCVVEKTFQNVVQILPLPEADFTFTPNNPKGENAIVEFNQTCKYTSAWQYIVDGSKSYFLPDIAVTFEEPGNHEVELIAKRPNGCVDSITKKVYIEPVTRYYVPNAFTPNGDGKNDVFKGTGTLNNMTNFTFEVYNRWGERVFSSTDPIVGWDGKHIKHKDDLPGGIYAYVYTYVDVLGVPIKRRGFVTLVR